MTFDAWRLSAGVDQGLPLDRALGWLEQLRSVQLPDLAHSKVQLCSELGAALVAFVASPHTRPGLYGLVDIGAWTTEISFFELARTSSGLPEVAFYSGMTFRAGVTDVDDRTLRAVYELWELPVPLGADRTVRASAYEIRAQREAGRFGAETLSVDTTLERRPTPATLEFPRDCVGERIRDSFRRAIVKAAEKERRPSAWDGFPIYVIGGGGKEGALWQRLDDINALVGSVSPLPENEDVRGVPKALAHRFVIAAGLAVPVPLWHTAHLPDEVEPYQAPKAKPMPVSEELGYDEP
jgi:hypothetical protein